MDIGAGNQGRWILATTGALLVGGMVVALFHIPAATGLTRAREAESRTGAVQLVNLRKDEAALTDPTPLFLPTEWNAAQNALPANSRRGPDSSFADFPPKWHFPETDLVLDFPAEMAVPARAADALAANGLGPTFLGLEKSGQVPTQLTIRKAFIEVSIAETGGRVLEQARQDANPPGATGWEPMEFLVAVDASGLVGPPVLTESSHVAAVDGYFQNYIKNTFHAGERLPSGFYRICIGP